MRFLQLVRRVPASALAYTCRKFQKYRGCSCGRRDSMSPAIKHLILDLYMPTSDGLLMGSAFGRAGRGGEGWLTYWLSSRNKVEVSYRLQTVSPKFIGGGRLADYTARGEILLGQSVSVAGSLQYEQWYFPVLNQAKQSDVVASVQLQFAPRWRITQ